MRIIKAVAVLALITAPAAAMAGKKPKLSGLELQQIQSKEFETTFDIAFPAVISVLQDAGYRINQADKDSGLITGTASTKSGLSWALIGGIGKSKKTPVVSAFIEPLGKKMSRVRLNFVMAKSKSHLYGMSSSDEVPILDAAVYKEAFEKIDKAIFVRQALDAPEPVATATPASVATGSGSGEPK